MISSNLPQFYKDSFSKKIFDKIKIFFFRKKGIVIKEKVKNIGSLEDNITNFADRIKEKNEKNFDDERKKILKELSDKPKMLEKFSTDRLEKILKWYKEENEKKREKIRNMTVK